MLFSLQSPELDPLKELSEEAISNGLASLVGKTIVLTAGSPTEPEAAPATPQGAGDASAAKGTSRVPAVSPGESSKPEGTGGLSDEELARRMQASFHLLLEASFQALYLQRFSGQSPFQ